MLSPDIENVKSARWRLASSLVVRAQMAFGVLESELHAANACPPKTEASRLSPYTSP